MPEGPEALRSFRSDFQNELRLAARVLVLSAAQRAILCRELGLAGDDFVVVPLGLAGDIVRPESPGPPPPLRAIVFGVHVPAKGTHVALEALRSAGKGVAIDVVGPIDKEGYGERLRGLAEGLDVTFHGRYELPDLARFRAHVAILPSLYFETYGLTLDEAHALGLPAIVTDRGALRERMSPADLAFPPGDATTLSRHLVRLRDSSAELLRLRAAVPKPRPFDDSVLAIEAACGDAVAGGPPDLSLDQFDSIPHLTPEGFAEREARFRWLAGKG
jgi:glycosyltransferase involved in cell wall biosynthesis